MQAVYVAIMWFLVTAMVYPILALVLSLSLQRWNPRVSVISAIFSDCSFRQTQIVAILFAAVFFFAPMGPTANSLNKDWQYAPSGSISAISWLWVLIPSAIGAFVGVNWFAITYKALGIDSKSKTKPDAG